VKKQKTGNSLDITSNTGMKLRPVAKPSLCKPVDGLWGSLSKIEPQKRRIDQLRRPARASELPIHLAQPKRSTLPSITCGCEVWRYLRLSITSPSGINSNHLEEAFSCKPHACTFSRFGRKRDLCRPAAWVLCDPSRPAAAAEMEVIVDASVAGILFFCTYSSGMKPRGALNCS